MDDVSG